MAEVLCIGATGTVGSLVVERLQTRGAKVRCMTRSAERAGTTEGDVEFVAGDLERPDSLARVFDGIGRVHLLTPLHPKEVDLAGAAVDAAKQAGVDRIVLHSVHRAEHAPQVPHFRSKTEILDATKASEIPWVSIEPNNYFQNDYWIQEPLLHLGIYPQPIGSVGTNRVDARDIADATVNALLDEGHEGNRYPIVGPHCLTGEDCARIWGEALGRSVVYVGADLDAWEKSASAMMPEWMVSDLRLMFEHFAVEGLRASEEDFASMSHVLGHAPRTFHDFVSETAAAWAAA